MFVLSSTASVFARLPYAGSFLAPPPVSLLVLFVWAGRPDYQAALFFARGPVLAVVSPSGQIQPSAPVSGWLQDNLKLALGQATVTARPPRRPAQIYLVTRRGQLSAACDSDAELIITLAEPLYPCRTGRPLVFIVLKERESWLIQLPEEANGVMPPFLSNLQTQRRPWRR